MGWKVAACTMPHGKPGADYSDSDIEEVDRRQVETSLTCLDQMYYTFRGSPFPLIPHGEIPLLKEQLCLLLIL